VLKSPWWTNHRPRFYPFDYNYIRRITVSSFLRPVLFHRHVKISRWTSTSPEIIFLCAMPYQVWTRSGTGSFAVIVPSPQTALATVEELSAHGHSDVLVKDMDGNGIELDVLKAIADMEVSRAISLVPR
jgi:hypothetical protein